MDGGTKRLASREDRQPPGRTDPLERTRRTRISIYLLAGSRIFPVVFFLVFAVSWYFVSGPFLEPIFWPLVGEWPHALEYAFLLCPWLGLWMATRWLNRAQRRTHERLSAPPRPAGPDRPIEHWVRSLEALSALLSSAPPAHARRGRSTRGRILGLEGLAAFVEARSVRGRYRWLARQLGHEDPKTICSLDRLPYLVHRQRAVQLRCALVILVPGVSFTLFSAPLGIRLAELLTPADGTGLAAALVCSDLRPGCTSPAAEAWPGRHLEMHVDADPAGRLDLTLPTLPRVWPIVRVVSTDGASRVRSAYADAPRVIEVHRTIYGRRLSIWYNVEPAVFRTTLAIDVFALDRTRAERTLLTLHNTSGGVPGGTPNGDPTMLNRMGLAALGACISIAACSGGFSPPREIVAPAEGRVNVPLDLVVTGTFTAADTFDWRADGGQFEGATNAPAARLVPTEPGPLAVVVTIRSADGSTTTPRATIHVPEGFGAASAGSTGDVPSVSAQPVAAAPVNIDREGFVPSGLMGDGEAGGFVTIDPNDRTQPRSPPSAYRVGYKPGPVGWAAIAWQYPANNWGDFPGKDLRRGFRQVSVWARADPDPRTGAYPVVQFKAGGATDPARKHQASFEVIGDFVTLTSEWTQLVLPLDGRNLSNVAAALTVVIRAQDVPASGVTFFLDDIEYQ